MPAAVATAPAQAASETDAYINGTTTVSQADAYQFAMGKTITADNGVQAKLRRPLDFLAVTDHGENLGLYAQIAAGDTRLVGHPIADRWSSVLELSRVVGLRNAFQSVINEHGPMPNLPSDILGTIWGRVARTGY